LQLKNMPGILPGMNTKPAQNDLSKPADDRLDFGDIAIPEEGVLDLGEIEVPASKFQDWGDADG
jgi:hypothetical protein